MSRRLINGELGGVGSEMDVLKIDGSRLQIPISGVRGKPRGINSEVHFPLNKGRKEAAPGYAGEARTPPAAQCASASGASHGGVSGHEEVVIDVRLRGDASSRSVEVESQQSFDVPAITVLVCYFAFGVALALCNMVEPALTRTVGMALSPLPVFCILAHAFGVRRVWISCGLVLCALLAPSVCALWAVPYSALYFCCLASLVVGGCPMPRSVPFLLAVFVCALLSLHPAWTGFEAKFWITVAFFFTVLTCALSFSWGFKTVYRLTKTTL